MSYYTLKSNNIIITDNKKYVLTIKDLQEKDKPREKLIEHGPDDLNVSELIAIILQTGTKKEDVLTMSSRLLKEYGEKTLANQKDPQVISKELDIPENKACQLVACFELGRRIFKKTDGGAVTIRDAKQAFNYLQDMRTLPKEQFRGLYLNSRYRLIHDEIISIGSLTASIIHPREVFKPAIEYSAAAVIVAHNHPSGSLKPTTDDIEVTQKLKQASEILGIDLLDHIIIGKNKFFSIPLL